MLWKHLSFAVTTLCHGSHFGKTEALQDTALIPGPTDGLQFSPLACLVLQHLRTFTLMDFMLGMLF